MIVCWSQCLGDCDATQSQEHYVSQAIVGKQEVLITGFPFLDRNEVRRIPAKRLTRSMLCRRHNALLSPLDAAAGYFFKTLAAFKIRGIKRAQGRRKRGGPDIYVVNGAFVERWPLKTAINIMFGKRLTASESDWLPPDQWVACAHGREPFPDGCGFYFITREGVMYESDESGIRIVPLTKSETDDTPIGAIFTIEHLTFAVSMERLHEQHRWGYRLQALKDTKAFKLRQLLRFDWSQVAESG